jgi:hypothetical protein
VKGRQGECAEGSARAEPAREDTLELAQVLLVRWQVGQGIPAPITDELTGCRMPDQVTAPTLTAERTAGPWLGHALHGELAHAGIAETFLGSCASERLAADTAAFLGFVDVLQHESSISELDPRGNFFAAGEVNPPKKTTAEAVV